MKQNVKFIQLQITHSQNKIETFHHTLPTDKKVIKQKHFDESTLTLALVKNAYSTYRNININHFFSHMKNYHKVCEQIRDSKSQ